MTYLKAHLRNVLAFTASDQLKRPTERQPSASRCGYIRLNKYHQVTELPLHILLFIGRRGQTLDEFPHISVTRKIPLKSSTSLLVKLVLLVDSIQIIYNAPDNSSGITLL